MNVTLKKIDDAVCSTCVTQDTCEIYKKYHNEYEVEACSDYKPYCKTWHYVYGEKIPQCDKCKHYGCEAFCYVKNEQEGYDND